MLTMSYALFGLCTSHPMVITHPMNTVFWVLCNTASSPSSFLQSCHAQVILGWRALEGGWLQRVVTHRLSTTGSLQTVLSGTDWGLAAVVAGKRWVKQAQAKGAAQDCRAAQVLRKQIGRLLLLVCCSHSCCCCCCLCAARVLLSLLLLLLLLLSMDENLTSKAEGDLLPMSCAHL